MSWASGSWGPGVWVSGAWEGDAAPSLDVRVGWAQFNPVAADVRVGWVQFNPMSADVRVGWVQFDPLAQAANEPHYETAGGAYRVSPRRQRGFARPIAPAPIAAVRRDDDVALLLIGAL